MSEKSPYLEVGMASLHPARNRRKEKHLKLPSAKDISRLRVRGAKRKCSRCSGRKVDRTFKGVKVCRKCSGAGRL